MTDDEARLVLRAQAGDAHAFDQLIRRYERPLFRHIHLMVADEELCYEVLQETYIQIVRSIRKLRSRDSFRPWTYGVATRVCLKTLARRPGRLEIDDEFLDPPDDHPLPDSLASAQEELHQVMDQVLLLTPKLRSVILLHFFEDLTLKETAAALELSLGTVKSRLNAGLSQVRTASPHGETP
jgi:RNA polymerase sigma-70 factor, ECF subfamily